MLREWKGVRQRPEEGFRRWFTDDEMDLIVWYEDGGAVRGFQLCYGKQSTQHAVTWMNNGTYNHAKVDDGESRPIGSKSTPILVQDGSFDSQGLASRFRGRAREIEEPLRSLVTEKIKAFS